MAASVLIAYGNSSANKCGNSSANAYGNSSANA